MRYYQLDLSVEVKRDIKHNYSYEQLSKLIASAMSSDDYFREVHNNKNFKYYNFNNLYKKEMPKDGIYREGEIYSFQIRSFDKEFIEVIKKSIEKTKNHFFRVLSINNEKEVNQFFITELESITPVISTREIEKKIIFWTLQRDGDIMKLINQLQDNLEKKYKEYFFREIERFQNFIEILKILNRKPQTIIVKRNGRDIKFFGNKLVIKINEDEVSQKLAFTALACGLGEKNAFGGGFCRAK